MENNKETVREDLGYRNIMESRSQQMQRLSEIKKGLENSQQKLPTVRIELKMDHKIYRYGLKLAMELIKNGKATLIEVLR